MGSEMDTRFMNSSLSIPSSTYRLQFNREFTFRDAAAIVPYLASLGISHCYASPYLRARPGSLHGYDIIDHNSVNPEIGSTEEYEEFVDQLHRHGMGQILDIVPNHMGVMGSDNVWWLDVLENGEASEFADFFDIDWQPVKDELRGKILIPVLGNQYGTELESGHLRLAFDRDRGEFSIFHHHHRFPIDPREYPRILLFRLNQIKEDLGPTHEDVLELLSIATALSHLPARSDTSPEQKAERAREKEVQKRRLSALVIRSSAVSREIEQTVVDLNGTPGDSKSFNALHEIIKAQVYRLAQWRVAADDINYRRFFDVNDLAALCMENGAVFAATHGLVLNLIAFGKVNGLRIDHPDGLYDPAKYLRQLQDSAPQSADRRPQEPREPIYVVVEKILTAAERLRSDWPVSGTTGYEFSNLVGGLFVDPPADVKMDRIYRAFTGETIEFDDLVYSCKKLILKVTLASELTTLANALTRIALASRYTCDFTMNSLRNALAEIIANFPVYRTYITDNQVSDEDRRYIHRAVTLGRMKSRAGDLSVFDFIQHILLTETNGDATRTYRRSVVRFAMKFQQVTSAVMAKGVEDTAFYRYNRLVSLNEVGGNPIKFGSTLDEFHAANHERLTTFPNSMLTTSTHDSKRSEDVRSRISVLSEFPALWRLKVGRWKSLNRGKKRMVDGEWAPSRNDEYLLYQTLMGAWPLASASDNHWPQFIERIEQYMIKAIREAKEYTSWASPNDGYETATTNFVRSLLNRSDKNTFLSSFSEFQAQISPIGMLNSLSQTLLKLTAPGVPDIYQGNELWDFSLVDPDNRRPVDYEKRRRLLADLQKAASTFSGVDLCRELVNHMPDGRIKLYLIWKTSCFRKSHTELFREGTYEPLEVTGAHARRVCAFTRVLGSQSVVIVVPRLWGGLVGEEPFRLDRDPWQDTRLHLAEFPSLSYRNMFTNEFLAAEPGGTRLSLVFRHFPVSLLSFERSE